MRRVHKFYKSTDLLGLRCAEEHRLPLLGQQLDDLVHLLLEPLLQDAVGLVDDQHLHVAEQEPLRVLEFVMDHGGVVEASAMEWKGIGLGG